MRVMRPGYGSARPVRLAGTGVRFGSCRFLVLPLPGRGIGLR